MAPGGLSVAVVTFNSASCVEGCLEAVARHLPEAEIIVVDNASSDDTVARAERASGRVRVVANRENVGFGRACNRAVELARGSHILFVNPDTRVVSVDSAALGGALGEPALGIRVGAVIEEAEAPGSRRPLLHRETSWLGDAVRHALGALLPRELRRPGPGRAAGEGPEWAAAALTLVRRTEFLGLGGFDPRFFLYYEDRELSARYRDAGLPIGLLPGVVGVHLGGGSSGADELRATPLAWAYLGWLEYVAIRWGRRRARAARALTRGPRATVRRAAVGLAGRGIGGRRLARKAAQLEAMGARVDQLAGDGAETPFCPVARELVAAGRTRPGSGCAGPG